MAEAEGQLLSPWDGTLPLFCTRYGGMRSEDISNQAQEYRVEPEPNLCVFRFWCDEADVQKLEDDTDIEVLFYEVMSEVV